MVKNKVNNNLFIIDYIKDIQNLNLKESEKPKKLFYFRNFLIAISIFLVPTLLGLSITNINFFSRANGTANGWLGFWGGYIGGIVGTLGVIYVAKLQNNKQREENEIIMAEQRELNQNQIDSQIDSLHKVEKFNRERLKIQTQLSLLEKYLSIVASLRIDIDYFNDNVMKMISSYLILKDLAKKANSNERIEDMKNLKTEVEVSWENIKSIKKTHFLKSFKGIMNQQLLLSSTDIKFTELSSDAVDVFSSLDESARFLDHYNLHIGPFIETRTDKIQEYNYHLKSYRDAINIIDKIDINAHSNISKLIKKLDK